MKKHIKLANEIRKLVDGDNQFSNELLKLCDKFASVEKPFPKHMIADGMLVYFIKPNHGYLVSHDEEGLETGELWYKFNMPLFKDCEIQVKS